MGEVLWPEDGRRQILGSDNVLGTDPSADLRLRGRGTSRLHARIAWVDGAWRLRDLGSRNGTYCNGRPIPPGDARVLQTGDRLGFGTAEPSLILSSAARPPASAVTPDGGVVMADGELLFLPDADAPEVTVFRADDGEWRAEVNGVVLPVHDGVALEVQGVPYRLSLAPEADETWEPRQMPVRLTAATLAFEVSADEEQVRVSIVEGARRIELSPRNHHYLLLVLARLRLADAAEGHADKDCGWVDREALCDMLRCTRMVLNKHVSRARQQLSTLGVVGAQDVVEVWGERRRIGVRDLVVT